MSRTHQTPTQHTRYTFKLYLSLDYKNSVFERELSHRTSQNIQEKKGQTWIIETKTTLKAVMGN